MVKHLLLASALAGGALIGATPARADAAARADALSCAQATQQASASREAWLETVVNLSYESIQARGVQFNALPRVGGQLGLTIEELCRQHPEASLRSAVDQAVRLTYAPAVPVAQPLADKARSALQRLALAEGYAKIQSH